MRLFVSAVIASVLLAGCCSSDRDTSLKTVPPPHTPTILLTGFEPFGGKDFNTSWMVIKDFDGTEIAGHTVHCRILPVVWQEASDKLTTAVQELNPAVVIGFGMGTPVVTIETTARNERRPYPDNLGKTPPATVVVNGGAASYTTRLPVETVKRVLYESGLFAAESTDAGGYLCNEVFYTIMHQAVKRDIIVAGFIHVPVIPPGSPEFTQLEAAVRNIIKECMSVPALALVR